MEAFEFVSDAFDLETALVPGVEDAQCARALSGQRSKDSVVDGMMSLCRAGWSWGWGWGQVGVGVGSVGVGGVSVVGWRVADELVNEELLVGSVLFKFKVVELLFEVFCEVLV